MGLTPHEFCENLARQRTSFSHDEQIKYTEFISQTYYFTYNASLTKQHRIVRRRLQKIRQLSDYIWILVAITFTFTSLAHLCDFDKCLKIIESWLNRYPLSQDQYESAHGQKLGKKVPRRNVPKRNLFPIQIKSIDISSPIYNINPGDSESAKGIQDFLSSIERESLDPGDRVIYISSEDQLHDKLEGLFLKPLFWRSYTNQHPIPGDMPTSITDFIASLTKINVQQLEAIDYAKDAATPKEVPIAEVAKYFQSPPMSRSALNFLDMENLYLPCVPAPVRQSDLLRTAYLRKRGSVSKSLRSYDTVPPDREFLLLSGRNSVSPIHLDTAGHLTWIIGISGRKIWYVPSDLTSAANRLATGGSQFPEHYEDGWRRIIIEPGDLLVMPPGCPHAVFTPEDSFTVGGHFYTRSHLSTTISTTALQARYGSTFCNESLSLQDYLNITLIFEQCKDLFSSADMARLVASKVYWECANQLNAHAESMSRYDAEHSTARPGGESLAKGSKGGSKKRGKTATKNAPTNREDTTRRDVHIAWLRILDFMQRASTELQIHLIQGDT
ncbi:hypothetical protein BO82DRAFT_286023 [Aspergillus uvarum CBS 121591]|uniref:JmjC domain-containing protein n=1 Tax=Aspergillus uvarum CBS 121591 TaxID=1448315 RepID=A0A319C5Z5_9EURO|nr:hypothetical protein BO82DRAFT_286023 [Aspergillus uvarum CBS 121591]PYH80604.1 hypothetical protein BO82DRAFT_286023 [Aspergillus uvarum CBS 121591]